MAETIGLLQFGRPSRARTLHPNVSFMVKKGVKESRRESRVTLAGQ